MLQRFIDSALLRVWTVQSLIVDRTHLVVVLGQSYKKRRKNIYSANCHFGKSSYDQILLLQKMRHQGGSHFKVFFSVHLVLKQRTRKRIKFASIKNEGTFNPQQELKFCPFGVPPTRSAKVEPNPARGLGARSSIISFCWTFCQMSIVLPFNDH